MTTSSPWVCGTCGVNMNFAMQFIYCIRCGWDRDSRHRDPVHELHNAAYDDNLTFLITQSERLYGPVAAMTKSRESVFRCATTIPSRVLAVRFGMIQSNDIIELCGGKLPNDIESLEMMKWLVLRLGLTINPSHTTDILHTLDTVQSVFSLDDLQKPRAVEFLVEWGGDPHIVDRPWNDNLKSTQDKYGLVDVQNKYGRWFNAVIDQKTNMAHFMRFQPSCDEHIPPEQHASRIASANTKSTVVIGRSFYEMAKYMATHGYNPTILDAIHRGLAKLEQKRQGIMEFVRADSDTNVVRLPEPVMQIITRYVL